MLRLNKPRHSDAVELYEKESGERVTENFTNINYVSGTLTVQPRSVTLTSANDSKPYDGTALQNHTVDVTGDGFVSGEGASYSFPDTSSQTEIGTCDNVFSYTLNSGTNAANYSITTVYGKLTVE